MAYDPTNLDATTEAGRVNIVRLWLGDTDTSEVQLTDDEILYFLSQTSNKTLRAASLAAYSIGSKYARLVNTELEGILKEDYSNLSDKYYKLSSELKAKANEALLGVGLPPNISSTTPEFYIGQFERDKTDDI